MEEEINRPKDILAGGEGLPAFFGSIFLTGIEAVICLFQTYVVR